MDVDWAKHWHAWQAARARPAGGTQHDFWDRRAPGFARTPPGRPSALMEFFEPWMDPDKTLIDVGACLDSRSAHRRPDRLLLCSTAVRAVRWTHREVGKALWPGALGGTRTPNLLTRRYLAPASSCLV